MGKKYKQLKDINLQDILDLPGSSFRAECLARLVGCGFVEVEEDSYKFGQHFRFHGNKYVLSSLGDRKAALVNIESGWSWSGIKPVQSNLQVTQAELDVLSEGAGNEIVPVE